MKQNLLYLLLFSFSFSFSFAQITLDNSYFPQEGDTIRTTTDFLFPDIDFDPAATAQQEWDFSSLQAGFVRTSLVKAASEGNGGSNFPNAELVVLDLITGGEEYINVTNDRFEVIGYFGADPVGLGINLATTLEKPLVQREAPLSFGAVHTNESAFAVRLAWDDLPTQVIDTLVNLPITPDSIGVILESDRSDFVDAYGSLTIPGGSWEVLRQRRIEERSTRVEAKVPILGWLDVTDLVPFAGLGDITLESYHFFSAETPEPIAVVNMNATQDSVQSIVFKYIPQATSTKPLETPEPGMAVAPNPAVSNVRFILNDLEPGNYTLQIFNLFGQSVWKRNYFVNRHKVVRENLYNLNAGTYFYILQNASGEVLLTRRLLMVKP